MKHQPFTHRRFSALAALLALGLAATGCSAAANAEGQEVQTVTVGVGELTPVNDAIEEVAKEQGVQINWQTFSDWTLPNQALANKENDVNAFQHLAFLSAFNTAEKNDLRPVGSTWIAVWGLYSKDHQSPESIPAEGTIAIPNDPSNGARALFLLEDAGLIKLKDNVGVYPQVDDITDNPKNLKFKEVVAQQLVTVYPEVDAIVLNSSMTEKGLQLTQEDALHLDDPEAETSLPYVNVIAVRGDDVDNELYNKLPEFWQDQRVIDANEKENQGNTKAVQIPVEKLTATLDELEKIANDIAN